MMMALFNTHSGCDLSGKVSLLVTVQRTPVLRLSCQGRAAEDTPRDGVRGLCQPVPEQDPQSLVLGLLVQLLEELPTQPCPARAGIPLQCALAQHDSLVPGERGAGPPLLCPREKVGC